MAIITEDEWNEIAWKLYRATKEGHLRWSEDDYSFSGTYLAFGEGQIGYRLASVDHDGTFPYRLEILRRDDLDTPIDSFVTESFHEGSETTSEAVNDLFLMVARQVSGISDTVKSILDELNGMLGIDNKPF